MACATATSASPAALCPCVVWGLSGLLKSPGQVHCLAVYTSRTYTRACARRATTGGSGHLHRVSSPPARLSLSRCCVRRWVRC